MIRSGFAIRFGQPETDVLAGEIFGRCRLRENADAEIQQILAEIEETNKSHKLEDFDTLLSQNFDRKEIAAKDLKYEKLDQLAMDILFGVR